MKVYWKTAASGDFSTSADWTPYGREPKTRPC